MYIATIMSQEIISSLLTLDQIKAQYPPKEETFEYKVREGKDIVSAQISRDEAGVILYVVPGSTTYIQRASKPEAPVQE